jgi:hypothetical protein
VAPAMEANGAVQGGAQRSAFFSRFLKSNADA